MIKYNLKCKHKHEFESWFLDSKEFEKLKSKKMIECIFCQTKSIEKSIMAPSVLSQEQNQKNQKSTKYIKKIQKQCGNLFEQCLCSYAKQKVMSQNFLKIQKNLS